MKKKLTPQLEEYKKDFDYLHKKIRELEWEYAIRSYERVALVDDVDKISNELDRYHALIRSLLEKVENEVNKEKQLEWKNKLNKK